MAGEVVWIVVWIRPVFARGHLEVRAKIDEVPPVHVVGESVAVVIHATDPLRLGWVRPDLAWISGDASAEIGMVGKDASIHDRHHDRAVAGRHVPTFRSVNVVTRRLVEPARHVPERIVRDGARREHGDRLRALHVDEPPKASQRGADYGRIVNVHDEEGGEIRKRRAGRRR